VPIAIDKHLAKEITWHQAVVCRLADRETIPLIGASLLEAIVLGSLKKAGMINEPEEDTFYLCRRFKRTPDMVVAIYRACEYATQLQQRGKEADDHLLEILEPRNWEPVEPAPRELKPLILKVRKELFGAYSEMRSMSLDQFWTVVRGRLVSEGLIEWRPHH
jgi:hypothetical protein